MATPSSLRQLSDVIPRLSPTALHLSREEEEPDLCTGRGGWGVGGGGVEYDTSMNTKSHVDIMGKGLEMLCR